jgi:hypothetical protein
MKIKMVQVMSGQGPASSTLDLDVAFGDEPFNVPTDRAHGYA